jgi:uncharacterized protein YbjT (DUF2867 family)
VRALIRETSRRRLVAGCEAVVGNVLDSASYAAGVPPADTLVHLVGTPRPSPAKAQQFIDVDLASVRAAIAAAVAAEVRHFIYVSVAQPAPVMKAYLAARSEGEALLRASGLPATVLRPWYVLGPGHRWPHVLLPAYWILERLPATKASARRLGLVTRSQMVRALVGAVANPASDMRVVTVEDIRRRV